MNKNLEKIATSMAIMERISELTEKLAQTTDKTQEEELEIRIKYCLELLGGLK